MLVTVASITLRELARNTTAVIQAVEASGRPALVTRNGRPVAALVPVNEAALEDWLLEHAASFTKAVAEGSPPEHLRGSHRGD